MPSLGNLRRRCQRGRRVQRDGEAGNRLRRRGLRVLQSSIAVREKIDTEIVDNEGNTFNMGENEVITVVEEMTDNDFGGAGSDNATFVAEITDILSSVASVVAT